ncbi:MAG: hypothetical protein WDM80_10450 [Limisphaerales bacterium]
MEHHALEVFDETFAEFAGGLARLGGDDPERFFVGCELKRFEPDGFAVITTLQKQKAAVVRQQNQAVMFEVIVDLFRFGDVINVIAGGFDFDDTARGLLVNEGFFLVPVFQLVGREQSAIRNAGAAVLGMDDAADFGFERVADGVQKIGERRITGGFLGRPAQRGDFREIGFQWVHCQ